MVTMNLYFVTSKVARASVRGHLPSGHNYIQCSGYIYCLIRWQEKFSTCLLFFWWHWAPFNFDFQFIFFKLQYSPQKLLLKTFSQKKWVFFPPSPIPYSQQYSNMQHPTVSKQGQVCKPDQSSSRVKFSGVCYLLLYGPDLTPSHHEHALNSRSYQAAKYSSGHDIG